MTPEPPAFIAQDMEDAYRLGLRTAYENAVHLVEAQKAEPNDPNDEPRHYANLLLDEAAAAIRARIQGET